LTPTQIVRAFLEPPRNEHGVVLPPPPALAPALTGREAFAYRLFLVGVRDPETVAALWAEERAKAPERSARKKKKRRR
jgi:hypothetical protein